MSTFWFVFNSFIPLLLYFCVLLLASSTWLRGVRLPISGWTWSLFAALVIYISRGITQTIGFGVAMKIQTNALSGPMVALRVALQFLVWIIVAKIFFRKARGSQVLITALAGTAIDALLLSGFIAWFLHSTRAVQGG